MATRQVVLKRPVQRARVAAPRGIPVAGGAAPVGAGATGPKGRTPGVLLGTEPGPVIPIAQVSTLRIAPVKATAEERIEEKSSAQARRRKLPRVVIEEVIPSVYSFEEMERMSVCEITKSYAPSINEPEPYTLSDPKMGPITMGTKCNTCHCTDCTGHYGFVKFKRPIYNPLMMRFVARVLNIVCHMCSRVLIPEETLRTAKVYATSFESRIRLLEKLSGNLACTHKHVDEGGAIIPCTPNPEYGVSGDKDVHEIVFVETKGRVKKTTVFPIEQVAKILDQIGKIPNANKTPNRDLEILGMVGSPPINYIMRGMLIPPPSARPITIEQGEPRQHDLTMAYMKIVEINNSFSDPINANKQNQVAHELFLAVRSLLDTGETFKTNTNKEFQSIKTIFGGKEGFVRRFMQGKRADRSSRTVLGTASDIEFGEIRVPYTIARTATRAFYVIKENIDYCYQLLAEDLVAFYTTVEGLRYEVHKDKRIELKPGYMLEKRLQDGDLIIFDRAPTLHKASLITGRARISSEDTWGLHEAYIKSTNHDHDGDEGNGTIPFEVEAQAEAEVIMDVRKNICTPEQSRTGFTFVQDSITAAWKLSQADTILDPMIMDECLELINNPSGFSTLRERARFYGINPLSGRYLLSALFPPDFTYQKMGIRIVEGIFLDGVITSAQMTNAPRSLIQELFNRYDRLPSEAEPHGIPETERSWMVTTNFITNATYVFDQYSTATQFTTVGFFDCYFTTPELEKALAEEKARLVTGYQALGKPPKDPLLLARYESSVLGKVSSVKGVGVAKAKQLMIETENNLGKMAAGTGSGAKGKLENLTQTSLAVGQQSLFGKRQTRTLEEGLRTLPSEDPYDPAARALPTLESQGYVNESYSQGLTPESCFRIHWAGRGGVLDTACKTGEVGDINHKMVRSFETAAIAYDGSVRNSYGVVMMNGIGEGIDGKHAMLVKMEGESLLLPFDLEDLVTNVNIEQGWIPSFSYILPDTYTVGKEKISIDPAEVKEYFESLDGESDIAGRKWSFPLSAFSRIEAFKAGLIGQKSIADIITELRLR